MEHDVGRRSRGGEMGNARQAVGQRIRSGQNRKNARHGQRCLDIDRADQGVGMRRAYRRAINLARKVEIVAVTAVAGDEAQVLLAAYRLSDAFVHDAGGYKWASGGQAILA